MTRKDDDQYRSFGGKIIMKRDRRNRTQADVTLALRELIRAELAHERASAADQARARELEARLHDARERYNRLVGAA